ncbi:MAG: molybdate ABC transporter substrate-binding protein [Armatimonadetes bacterium]|nr:molybdate ABC transporter substrate-binding protein [Armatimonadota bacterium]
MSFRKLTLVAGVVALAGSGCRQVATTPPPARPTQPAPPTSLSVYIPCGIIIPMKAALDAFKQTHPEIAVRPTFDNPLALERKVLKERKLCDVYIASGPLEVNQLAEKGLADKSSLVRFGQLELVVLVPKANPARIKVIEDIVNASTVACPDPKYNSLGDVAKRALEKLGLWQKLAKKLVLTEFAIDAYKHVASGRADAGIAYRSCPLETNPAKLEAAKVRVACSFPPDSYPAEDAQFHAVITSFTTNRPAAETFLRFLAAPATAEVMASKGLPSAGSAAAPSANNMDAKVHVVAFYPDTEGHADIKALVLSLNHRFPGKVKAEFVDFTSDEGFKRWQDAGLSCGAILINGKQTVTIRGPGGTKRQVTFSRYLGGEWEADDLIAAVRQEVEKAYPGSSGKE